MLHFSMLEELLSQAPACQAWLPDRFLDEETSEQAWSNVFGQEKRLKKLADGIRKCDLMRSLSAAGKKIVQQRDAYLLTFFYGSEPMRGFVERSVRDTNNNALTLTASVPWLAEVFLEANPSESRSTVGIDTVLSRVDSEFADSFMRVFHAVSNQDFYDKLKPKHRDIADLVVNLILTISDAEQTLAFFKLCPWLGETQTRFVKQLEEMLENDEPQTPESRFADELIEKIRRLYSIADDYRDEPSLQRHVAIRSMIREIALYQEQHGASSFTQILMDEHQQMVGLFTRAGDVFKRYKISEALDLWARLLSEIETLPEIKAIDAACDEQIRLLEAFLGNRREIIQPAADGFKELRSSVIQLESSMEKLSKITQSQDGALDEILKLNEELIASRAKAIEKAQELAPVGVRLIEQISSLGKEIQRLQAIPKVDFVARSAELAQQVEGLTDRSDALERQVGDLTAKNQALESAVEKERGRRINQEEVADNARKEIHDLKTAMANIGRPSATPPPAASPLDAGFVVDLMTGSAKLTAEVILNTFATLYPEDLVVLDSAYKSAKEAYNFEMGSRLATLIQSLVDYLNHVRQGKPDSEARTILGSSYASHESNTVINNAKLRAKREFTYEGRVELFMSHVSVGRGFGTQHQIRVYFKIIDSKLVIAYCGERFESATSN